MPIKLNGGFMEILTKQLKEELTKRQDELKDDLSSKVVQILEEIQMKNLKSEEKLTPKKIDDVTQRLYEIASSLKGFGTLFKHQSEESSFDQMEHEGIGFLLQGLSEEISRAEGIIHDGKSCFKEDEEKNSL